MKKTTLKSVLGKFLLFIFANSVFLTYAKENESDLLVKVFIKTINLGKICFQKQGTIYACKTYGMYLETFTLLPEDKEYTQKVKNQLDNCYKFIKSHLKPVNILTDNATEYVNATDEYEITIDAITEAVQDTICRGIIIETF